MSSTCYCLLQDKIDKESSEDYHHLVLMIHDSTLCRDDTMDMSFICIISVFFQLVKKQSERSHQCRDMLQH